MNAVIRRNFNIYIDNFYYNKYEYYAAPNRETLHNNYFKLPNLIDRFIRGGDKNIGEYYEDTVKNHKHATNGHDHPFTIQKDYSHNHTGTAKFIGELASGHKHTFPLQTIDVSFDKIREGVSSDKSKIGQLLVPQDCYVEGYLDLPGKPIITDAAGQHEPKGSVHLSPANANVSINISENTNANSKIKLGYEDISGIVDMNDDTIPETNETRPKHVILLPCIAIGTNNVQASSTNLESYSVQSRVTILEERANNFDICMNSSRINIHKFIENPSGTGLLTS